MRVDRMGNMISCHIRSNVVGYLALFLFAIGGTAYATHPGGEKTISSVDIIDDEVQAVDIASGAVNTSDIANEAVTSAKVANGTLQAVDYGVFSVGNAALANNAVGSANVIDASLNANDLGPDSVTSSEVAANAIGSSEIISNGVGSSELAPGAPGKLTGAAFADPCDPGAAFLSCGAVSLNLPAAGSVLLLGSGGFMGTASGADTGTCQISEHPSTTAIGGNMTFGQAGSEHNSFERADGFALSALDTGNAAGLHTWTLLCNETAGAVQVRDPKLSAIYLR